MRVGRFIAFSFVALWGVAAPARAHRLDEYLQATTVDLAKGRVAVQMRLTPGVEVIRAVLGVIDTDGDGVISEDERRAYAERVKGDLSLVVDGEAVQLRVASARFPEVERMREGLGDVEIDLEGRVAEGGAKRRLVFENRHLREVSVYLVNCLVPADRDVRIGEQRRNVDQSRYEVEYTQANVRARGMPVAAGWSTVGFWVAVNAVVLGVWGVMVLRRRWVFRAADTAGKPAR